MRRLAPDEDLVYLADSAHVPYGDRTPDDLHDLLAQNLARLEGFGVDAIVMGCNTSCAVAANLGWPPARVPILDLIETTAEFVVNAGARRIGVIATTATITSGAYGAALRARDATIEITEVAAPALVPLVEAGKSRTLEARLAVADALRHFTRPIDALILGCTHFPWLRDHFGVVLHSDVTLIDPADAQARAAARALITRATPKPGSGKTHFVTTGPVDAYASALADLPGIVRQTDTITGLPVSAPL